MRRHPRRTAIALVIGAVVVAIIAVTVAFTGGSSSMQVSAAATRNDAGPAGHAQHVPPAFRWLRPGPAPATWRSVRLPAGGAVLSYPPSLRPFGGDRGTVSEGRAARSGLVTVYLNATPRQGEEDLRNWPSFRMRHLLADDARSARLLNSATGLPFRGGTGSCVMDSYVTKVHANHYREIACYVQGAHRASVVIAATPAADWGQNARLLEKAISAYMAN
jgi:hypothetical protein